MEAPGKSKLKEVESFLEKEKLGGVIFLNFDPTYDVNIQYFTNFVQRPGGYWCTLFISHDSRDLFVSSLDYDRARTQVDAEKVLNSSKTKGHVSYLKKKFKKGSRLGVIKDLTPLSVAESLQKNLKVKLVDVSGFFEELRSVKTHDEIKMLRKSADIANHGLKYIEEILRSSTKTKVTEKELAVGLEDELKRKGAEAIAFETICVTNERSAFPHPFPNASDKIISSGMGYVDFGAVYQGYNSDVTVPFIIEKISDSQKKIIKTTLDTYDLAIKNLRVGEPEWKLFQLVENFLKKNKYEFIHGLGHGLGLKIHDSPSIGGKPKDKERLKTWKETLLKENMVFTIEPGVYAQGVGGCRIENDILMKKNGIEILTDASLIEI